jgi:adenine-specific DNA-methyltransferase
MKYRNVQLERPMEDEPEFTFLDDGSGHYQKLEDLPTDPKGVFKRSDLKSSGYTPTCIYDFDFHGHAVKSKGRKSWRTNQDGMRRLIKANRLFNLGDSTYFRQYFSDSPMRQMENTWTDTAAGFRRADRLRLQL